MYRKVDLGFFSQTGLVLFPLHLKGFSNRFYRFWGLSGKPSEHEVSFAKTFAFLRAFFDILSFVNIEEGLIFQHKTTEVLNICKKKRYSLHRLHLVIQNKVKTSGQQCLQFSYTTHTFTHTKKKENVSRHKSWLTISYILWVGYNCGPTISLRKVMWSRVWESIHVYYYSD